MLKQYVVLICIGVFFVGFYLGANLTNKKLQEPATQPGNGASETSLWQSQIEKLGKNDESELSSRYLVVNEKGTVLFEMDVRRLDQTDRGGGWATYSDSVSGESVLLREIISSAYDVDLSRIEGVEDSSDLQKYDLSLSVSGSLKHLMKKHFQEGIEEIFNIGIQTTTQNTEVYVLHAMDLPKISLSTTKSGSNYKGGKYSAMGVSLDGFCRFLSDHLERTVVNDTGLDGLYSFQLSWDQKETQSILESIPNQLGLKIDIETRPLEVLIVEYRSR